MDSMSLFYGARDIECRGSPLGRENGRPQGPSMQPTAPPEVQPAWVRATRLQATTGQLIRPHLWLQNVPHSSGAGALGSASAER